MSKDGWDLPTLILMQISHFDRTALYSFKPELPDDITFAMESSNSWGGSSIRFIRDFLGTGHQALTSAQNRRLFSDASLPEIVPKCLLTWSGLVILKGTSHIFSILCYVHLNKAWWKIWQKAMNTSKRGFMQSSLKVPSNLQFIRKLWG